MRATLKFHKKLRRFTNGVESITVDATSYIDLVNAATSQFPDLYKFFKHIFNGDNKGELALVKEDKKLVNLDELDFPPKNSTLVPVVYGSGGNGGLVAGIAIIAIIAISFFTGGLGLGLIAPALTAPTVTAAGTVGATGVIAGASLTALGQFALGIGVSLVLSSLAPKPQAPEVAPAPDSGSRIANDSFASLENSTSSDSSVPLVYGMHRVSGQFISGYVKTFDHGKNDTISVGDQF